MKIWLKEEKKNDKSSQLLTFWKKTDLLISGMMIISLVLL
jgi:hypothetical protein